MAASVRAMGAIEQEHKKSENVLIVKYFNKVISIRKDCSKSNQQSKVITEYKHLKVIKNCRPTTNECYLAHHAAGAKLGRNFFVYHYFEWP